MANTRFKTMLALKRLAANITSGLGSAELQAMLDAVLATEHTWGMAHDLVSVKALIAGHGGEMTAGQRRMAALLVNEELDRRSCDKGWERACIGTPLTEYRTRTFRSGKVRVFVHANGGGYCDVRPAGSAAV